jgi:hypothetical protein
VIGALDMPHESSSALSNEVITLRATVEALREALMAIETSARHESDFKEYAQNLAHRTLYPLKSEREEQP